MPWKVKGNRSSKLFGTDPASLHDYAKGADSRNVGLGQFGAAHAAALSRAGWNSFEIANEIGKVSARHIRAVLGAVAGDTFNNHPHSALLREARRFIFKRKDTRPDVR